MRSLILKSLTLAGGLAVLAMPLSGLAGGVVVNGSTAEVQKRAAASSGFIQVASPAKAFAYQPPMRGTASSGRVGGGTRGTADAASVTVEVLAPDHAGLTVSEQPTLYWFVSQRIEVDAELTIVDETSIDPLLELKLKPPIEAGIHALSLKEHGVQLKTDVPYQWFVAVVMDPSQRSYDLIAGGEITRVAQPSNLAGTPQAYAEAGIWYDLLDGLSTEIGNRPKDTELRQQRAALLEQVGLAGAAEYERASNR
ncbi:MAG: DUF928 domain-containing protein [Gammaproteobacteria bacterium]|nr:DUF928 domain-containing protein [Gammaproteobacteria bacterium]NIM72705.1 DUF928 domain-containing protein [Gammaproteobacteria bacterium]NIN37763.1 DUF928 domain-containing protein [Gammaproteobacteria bacterium]NIO24466.1 DUF928 domain-containing protein [Gammaproteobacteria bacterium]NIO65069.1 DUF928 domain-containing protein [Gammaproteobacteria bacterium]